MHHKLPRGTQIIIQLVIIIWGGGGGGVGKSIMFNTILCMVKYIQCMKA